MVNNYEVIIIGGGIVGAGIARDLSMRGMDTLLLERGDLATGATGRSHALLHSGARYVVKDPVSAEECAKENLVLKKIAGHIVEDTGGLFVSLPSDPEDYPEKFERGCAQTGVKCEKLTVKEALDLESLLNRDIRDAYFVNDGHVDPFRITYLNALDALENGAVIKTYHEVVEFIKKKDEVVGVKVHDVHKNRIESYHSDLVVLAAGAWSGDLLKKVNVKVDIKPSRGTIIVYSQRIFKRVVNRLRKPSDGDIIVPSYGNALLGTTSITIQNPDDFRPYREEIKGLIREGIALAPILKKTRIIKVFAGPRPLIGGEGREATRNFQIFDHEKRDGVNGLITIAGGKLTTYRLMAEKVSDLIMEKLGSRGKSKTHKEPLPGYYDLKEIERMAKKQDALTFFKVKSYRKWGNLTERFFKSKNDWELACFCEHVTVGEIKFSIRDLGAKTIGDVMRRTRATMGPCQSQNCLMRIASLLVEYSNDYGGILAKDLVEALEKKWRLSSVGFDKYQIGQMALQKAVYNLFGNLGELKRGGEFEG